MRRRCATGSSSELAASDRGYFAQRNPAGTPVAEAVRCAVLVDGIHARELAGSAAVRHHREAAATKLVPATRESPTFGNLFFSRGYLVNGDPQPAAERFTKNLRIYPLAQAATPPAMNFVNGSGKAMNTIHSMDVSFFDEVNEVVQQEPSDAIDPEMLGLLASIGIEKGKPFAPDERMKTILIDAAAVGSATARANAYRPRGDEFYLYPGTSNWRYAFVGGSYLFERNGARLLDPRTYFFFAFQSARFIEATPCMRRAGSPGLFRRSAAA